jgi:hypothetical protein
MDALVGETTTNIAEEGESALLTIAQAPKLEARMRRK